MIIMLFTLALSVVL